MNIHTAVSEVETPKKSAKAWSKIIDSYGEPAVSRSLVEIGITIVPFCILWAATAYLVVSGMYWGLILTIPAAGFLLRLFAIQHDCGHGSFFKHRVTNDWVGRVFGVFTFTPYFYWQRSHAFHHAGSGCLDHRGFGDIETLTVEEYSALTPARKLQYRMYRNPFVMFGLGPAFIFLLKQRLPFGMMKAGWKPWLSTLGTNLGMAAAIIALMMIVGWKTFLIVQLPITIIAASAGVWLFFVQHQFEETIWEYREDWDRHEAALMGSSFYDLPPILNWFSANIGMHHLHHLCSKIPYYHLPKVLKEHPELRDVARLTFWQSFKNAQLALWDEAEKKLVSFKSVRRAAMV